MVSAMVGVIVIVMIIVINVVLAEGKVGIKGGPSNFVGRNDFLDFLPGMGNQSAE